MSDKINEYTRIHYDDCTKEQHFTENDNILGHVTFYNPPKDGHQLDENNKATYARQQENIKTETIFGGVYDENNKDFKYNGVTLQSLDDKCEFNRKDPWIKTLEEVKEGKKTFQQPMDQYLYGKLGYGRSQCNVDNEALLGELPNTQFGDEGIRHLGGKWTRAAGRDTLNYGEKIFPDKDSDIMSWWVPGGGCIGSTLGSGAGSEGFTEEGKKTLVARRATHPAGMNQLGINTRGLSAKCEQNIKEYSLDRNDMLSYDYDYLKEDALRKKCANLKEPKEMISHGVPDLHPLLQDANKDVEPKANFTLVNDYTNWTRSLEEYGDNGSFKRIGVSTTADRLNRTAALNDCKNTTKELRGENLIGPSYNATQAWRKNDYMMVKPNGYA